jgi:hypothetical protein
MLNFYSGYIHQHKFNDAEDSSPLEIKFSHGPLLKIVFEHNYTWISELRVCPLCKRSPETITHLVVNCHYTFYLWGFVKD